MTGHPYLRRLAGRLLRLSHRIEMNGMERIPQTGRIVLAMTHCGVRGGLILETYMARDLVFVASANFLRLPLIRGIARHFGGIFVSSADMLDARFFDEANKVLASNSILGVMVQGKQMDDVAGAPKRGAAYLACRLDADILPVRVLAHGLTLQFFFGELIPHPASVNGKLLSQTMASICAQLGIGWKEAA